MHPQHHSHVLQLDIQGTPQAWISLEHAALHVASDAVAWVDGHGPLATLRGGFNVARGRQSLIEVHPIVALRGASRVNLFEVVPLFGRPHAGGIGHAARVPAVRTEPLRGLPPRRPQRPCRHPRVAGRTPAEGIAPELNRGRVRRIR